ncbi:MAG: urease accessory protein [Alphaproteobacteria bacterium]
MDVLLLGFLVGIGHAIEADHLATVSTLIAKETGVRRIVRHGFTWGLGHNLALFVVAGLAILTNTTLPASVSAWLEALIGVMLILLGAQVLYRVVRDRIHVHAHRHAGGELHLHAHSHRHDTGPHDASPHDHDHRRGLPLKTFGIGLLHGLAGSAALIILTAATFSSPWLGLIYVLLFGVGSMVGMAMLSMVIALPLAWSARVLTWTHHAFQGTIGIIAMLIGGHVLQQSAIFF